MKIFKYLILWFILLSGITQAQYGEFGKVNPVASVSSSTIDSLINLKPIAYTDQWGNPSGGMKFDGVDDVVTVADNNNFDFHTGDGSVEVWVKFNSVATTQEVFSRNTDGNNGGYLQYANSGRIVFALYSVYGTNGYRVNLITNVTPVTGIWQHITVVFGQTTSDSKIYLNGVPQTLSVNTVNVYDFALTQALKIGNSASSYLNGTINSLLFYNRALTQAEVTSKYNNGEPQDVAIDYADLNASQTELGSSPYFSDGTTLSAITSSGYTHDYPGDDLTDNTAVHFLGSTTGTLGKDYLFSFDLTYNSGSVTGTHDALGMSGASINLTSGHNEFVKTSNGINGLYLTIKSSTAVNFTISNFSVIQLGCVASYEPENAGRLGWIETQNGLHGSTSGSPISLSAEQRSLIYRDVKLSVANTATTLTNIVPKGYRIDYIRALGSNSLTGVKIGTSSGGEQIVTSTTASTTASILTLAGNTYNETASTTLYAEHATAAETLNLIFVFRKVGN